MKMNFQDEMKQVFLRVAAGNVEPEEWEAWWNSNRLKLEESLNRDDLDRNDRIALFHCIQKLKGKEEVLDYFLDYLSTEEDTTLLIYAVWCTEGVENRQLKELYVGLMDKYRTHENMKFDYKGSQMVLRGGASFQ